MPPRYFPLACSELGEDWASSPRDLFFTYEEKITTNGSTSSEMTYFGEGPNAGADYSDSQYGNLSTSEFVKGCRQQCISLGKLRRRRCKKIVRHEKSVVLLLGKLRRRVSLPRLHAHRPERDVYHVPAEARVRLLRQRSELVLVGVGRLRGHWFCAQTSRSRNKGRTARQTRVFRLRH